LFLVGSLVGRELVVNWSLDGFYIVVWCIVLIALRGMLNKRCPRFNVFDKRSGNVIVCPLHPNPHGILMRRRKKVSRVLRCSK